MTKKRRLAARGTGLGLRAGLLAAGMAATVLAGCSCEGPGPRRAEEWDRMPNIRVLLGHDASEASVSVGGPWTMLRPGAGEAASSEAMPWTRLSVRGAEIPVSYTHLTLPTN